MVDIPPSLQAPFLIQAINWQGVRTLYRREVWRYMKVWNQTLVAPIVTTLIWLTILTLALSGNGGSHAVGLIRIPYTEFIAPGLIMMSATQNAFANASSSLILSKIQGVIIDVLMPPFSAWEITFCLTMGGVTRGVMVGLVVGVVMALFVPVALPHPLLALFYLVIASVMLALFGVIGGIWAQGFDQLTALTNYFITPLTFLSGTFYSIKALPGMWHVVCTYNPFFYMIDGFRYALTGYHDGSLAAGAIALVVLTSLLWVVAQTLVARGWHLKS